MNLLRLMRTVRHLTPRQLAAQTRVRLFAQDPARVVQLVPTDGAQPQIRFRPRAAWRHPDGDPPRSEDLAAGRFSFVGHLVQAGSPPNWNARGRGETSRLWRYNLHYHGFLFSLEPDEARPLVLDYIERHAPSRAAEGWEPYPLSLRAMNWIAYFFGAHRAATLAERDFAARLWLELRRMLISLTGRVETHLMANHLLENAFAFALAGACFDGPEAESWRTLGGGLLASELAEQVLDDGGHFERSPMYQSRLLFGLASLLNTGDEGLERLCRPYAERMLGWLDALTHPDGGIALFNDAALGVYPEPRILAEWLAELGVTPERAFETGRSPRASWDWLDASGYFACGNELGDRMILDAGEIGPAYQPGHAHADFLSLELSLGGRRFLVDGGTSDYGWTPERAWSRSVRAHNTILIEGEEPLEFWGAFRIGRRGRPVDVRRAASENGELSIDAGHTGYRHLRGAPTPRREARWRPSGELRLSDRVDGASALRWTSQLRVDGDWLCDVVASDRLCFTHAEARDAPRVWVLANGPIARRACRWFPRFGTPRSAELLQQSSSARADVHPVRWVVARDDRLPAALAWLAQT